MISFGVEVPIGTDRDTEHLQHRVYCTSARRNTAPGHEAAHLGMDAMIKFVANSPKGEAQRTWRRHTR
jgi:hypothetical protein